jgi:hypothetical protein
MASKGKRTRRVTRNVPREVTGQVTGQTPKPLARTRIPVRAAIKLLDEQVAKLCIASLVSIRTIERWAMGLAVHRTTRMRLEQAMQKCGIAKHEKVAGHGRRRVVTVPPDQKAVA